MSESDESMALFVIIMIAIIVALFVTSPSSQTKNDVFGIHTIGNQTYAFLGLGGMGCIDTVENVSYSGGYEGFLDLSCLPIPKGINISTTCVVTTYSKPLSPSESMKILNEYQAEYNINISSGICASLKEEARNR
ncbi:MAG: hypothetical protein QW478_04680 [Candidatus Micrarchaeaceae archaeon]